MTDKGEVKWMTVGKPDGATSMSVWFDLQGRLVKVKYGYDGKGKSFKFNSKGSAGGGGRA